MLEAELRGAVELARAAGRVLMQIYATDFPVDYKGPADPVTEADRRANELLVRELRRRFPGDGVVAEELSEQPDAAARGGRCWYVDPCDGTREFVARNGEFAVMLGLAIEGESRLGVVYGPAEDLLLTGVVGQGAHLHQSGQPLPLRVSDTENPAQLRLVTSRSRRSRHIDSLVDRLGIVHERTCGSVGLKIAMLARRQADFYVHLSDVSSAWDACGPEAILRAAGGRFTDLGGRPFVYGGGRLSNAHGILACNAAAFDRVLPDVRAVARDARLL